MTFETAALQLDNAKLLNVGGAARIIGRPTENLAIDTAPVITANTWTAIADLGDDFGNESQNVNIMVYWGGANTGGATYYWQTAANLSVGLASATNMYNATAGFEYQNVFWTAHHHTIDLPELKIDSDGTEGAYGNATLYIKTPASPASLNFTSFNVRVLPLLSA